MKLLDFYNRFKLTKRVFNYANICAFVFGSFVIYLIYLEYIKRPLIEGMKDKDKNKNDGSSYQDYSGNPNVLVFQNASNIQFLKSQVDDLTKKVNDLAQQQSDYATSVAGDQPPEVTGVGSDENS